jgi:hypothetical protein
MGASKPTSAAQSEQDPLSEALDVDADEYAWVAEQLETAGIQLQHARLEDDDGQEGEGGEEDEEGAGGGGDGGWADPSEGGALLSLLSLLEDGDDDADGDQAGGQQEQAETEQLLCKVAALLARLAPAGPLVVSLPGPDGDTALHLAALYGRAGCARRLLAAGADAGAANPEDGTLPLHDAAAGGYDAIVDLLLESAGGGGGAGAGDGVVAVGAGAGAAGAAGAATTAAGARAWLAHCDEDGDTPLHCAARGGHLSTVRRLLRAGADPSRQNDKGCTPRDESDDDKVRALLARVAEREEGGGGGVGE